MTPVELDIIWNDHKTHEQGILTLLELMVTVVIIGILTAIAVPTNLNQKSAEWDASAESDVRNATLSITTEDFKRRW